MQLDQLSPQSRTLAQALSRGGDALPWLLKDGGKWTWRGNTRTITFHADGKATGSGGWVFAYEPIDNSRFALTAWANNNCYTIAIDREKGTPMATPFGVLPKTPFEMKRIGADDKAPLEKHLADFLEGKNEQGAECGAVEEQLPAQG